MRENEKHLSLTDLCSKLLIARAHQIKNNKEWEIAFPLWARTRGRFHYPFSCFRHAQGQVHTRRPPASTAHLSSRWLLESDVVQGRHAFSTRSLPTAPDGHRAPPPLAGRPLCGCRVHVCSCSCHLSSTPTSYTSLYPIWHLHHYICIWQVSDVRAGIFTSKHNARGNVTTFFF